jgi:hypothetical protein
MPEVVGVMQVKVWLLGISPMVWRRVLVRGTCSLRELHGVIQVAMGWQGHHCKSAWGPDADRRGKLLVRNASEGSYTRAGSHVCIVHKSLLQPR